MKSASSFSFDNASKDKRSLYCRDCSAIKSYERRNQYKIPRRFKTMAEYYRACDTAALIGGEKK